MWEFKINADKKYITPIIREYKKDCFGNKIGIITKTKGTQTIVV
jgi:hypothetical protein